MSQLRYHPVVRFISLLEIPSLVTHPSIHPPTPSLTIIRIISRANITKRASTCCKIPPPTRGKRFQSLILTFHTSHLTFIAPPNPQHCRQHKRIRIPYIITSSLLTTQILQYLLLSDAWLAYVYILITALSSSAMGETFFLFFPFLFFFFSFFSFGRRSCVWWRK